MAPTYEEERIQKIFSLLLARGISKKQLRASTAKEIDQLVPDYLTAADVLILKVTLRQEKTLFQKYHDVVGRVSVKSSKGAVEQLGSCVLVGADGLTITSLHTLILESSKGTKKARKGKDLVTINVVFPNTIAGKMVFDAEIIDSDPSLDIALLQPKKPLHDKYKDVNYISDWASHCLMVKDTVTLFSFPLLIDNEFDLPNSTGRDLPSTHEGKITLIPDSSLQSEVLTSYLSFGACSGGLVVCEHPEMGTIACGIHLQSIHESDNMKNLNLDALNEIAGHKGNYGVFFRGVPEYLMKYSSAHQPKSKKVNLKLKIRDDRAIIKNLRNLATKGLSLEEIISQSRYIEVPIKTKCPRAIEIHDKGMKKKEEELDLFGPWPGFDVCSRRTSQRDDVSHK